MRLLLELFRLHLGQLLLPWRGIRVDQDALGVQEQVLPLPPRTGGSGGAVRPERGRGRGEGRSVTAGCGGA